MNKNIIGWVMIIIPALIGIEEIIRNPTSKGGNPIIWMWIVGAIIIVGGITILLGNKKE